MHYYETTTRGGFVIGSGETVAHGTLDEAINYANQHGDVIIICEIGGNWCEFERCAFCGEWFDSCELNTWRECERCEEALKSHGGY